MHRGLLDRVLVAPAAVAVFVGLVLTPSARAAFVRITRHDAGRLVDRS